MLCMKVSSPLKRLFVTHLSSDAILESQSGKPSPSFCNGQRKNLGTFLHPNNPSASLSASILAEKEERQDSSDLVVQDDLSTKAQHHLPQIRSGRHDLTSRGFLRDQHITPKNQYLKLAEVITPLWNTPYPKQLNIKFLNCVDFLKTLQTVLHKKNVDLHRNQYGLPCDLLKTVSSPKWRWYRNNDEFVVHVGVDGYTPTVGLCLGNPRDVSKAICVEPGHLTNIKKEHKDIAQEFQEYVRTSGLSVSDDLNRNHWRKLLVRSNQRGQLMVAATMHRHNLTEFDVSQEKKRFVKFLTEDIVTDLDLRSVYFQTLSDPPKQQENHRDRQSVHYQSHPNLPKQDDQEEGSLDLQSVQNESLSDLLKHDDKESMLPEVVRPAPQELLWGEPYLEEMQGGLRLRICPYNSLLENTAVADGYFQALEQALDLKPQTTLLDINCGTGALGLYLSRLVTRVIGVKTTPGKIADVYFNAETNGIQNVSFTQRTLLSVLKQTSKQEFTDLVAVINPSEESISRECVIRLKGIPSLRRIVCLTDRLDGRPYKNIVLLSQMFGKNLECQQFLPVQAIPIDIYPQTNTYYFAIVFERFT